MCYASCLYVKFTYYSYFLENMKSFDLLCKMNSALLKLYLPIPMGVRALVCWNCGFQYRRGYECLSAVSFVCCQDYMSGWSLVQRSPTECVLCVCVIVVLIIGDPGPVGTVEVWERRKVLYALLSHRLCLEITLPRTLDHKWRTVYYNVETCNVKSL